MSGKVAHQVVGKQRQTRIQVSIDENFSAGASVGLIGVSIQMPWHCNSVLLMHTLAQGQKLIRLLRYLKKVLKII